LLLQKSLTYVGERELQPFYEEPETPISILAALQSCSWTSLHYAVSTFVVIGHRSGVFNWLKFDPIFRRKKQIKKERKK